MREWRIFPCLNYRDETLLVGKEKIMRNQVKTYSLGKSKRGNIAFDGLTIFILFIGMILVGVLCSMLLDDWSLDWSADPTNSDESKAIVQQSADDFENYWDTSLIILFVGLWFALLVSAYLIETSPIFFFVTVILMILLLIAIVYLGNAGYDVVNDGDFGTEFAEFPKANFILNNILMFFVVICLSVFATLYWRR